MANSSMIPISVIIRQIFVLWYKKNRGGKTISFFLQKKKKLKIRVVVVAAAVNFFTPSISFKENVGSITFENDRLRKRERDRDENKRKRQNEQEERDADVTSTRSKILNNFTKLC